MVFEHIEQLKRDWTDKYVLVDGALPELRRFVGMTGTVKTVNYSGRALVQFDAYNNTGWFDIDTRFLKIVDAPLPKPVKEEKAEKKAAPAKAEKPAEKAATPAKPAATSSRVPRLAPLNTPPSPTSAIGIPDAPSPVAES